MFSPLHFGLYFTPAHVKTAQDNRDKPPFDAAWKLLLEHEETGIQAARWLALRYRFQNDALAGERAVEQLLSFMQQGLAPDMTLIDALQETLAQAHALEMVRDHDAMASQLASVLGVFGDRIQYFQQLDHTPSFIEFVLMAQVNLVGGIVLEREDLFAAAVQTYETIVRDDIHPQGYIQRAVELNDGGGLLRQIMSVSAFVQMAVAAEHVGARLWDYTYRGVSVMTAFSYLPYYYFYPEKWRWDPEMTNAPFKDYSGFLEIVNHRAYPKDLKPILDELRPIYDVCAGGLTTLTHGVSGRPKRGLFR